MPPDRVPLKICAAALLLGFISLPAAAQKEYRPENWKIDNSQVNFAPIDSLLNLNELSLAEQEIVKLLETYGEHPIYAGPIQARMGVLLMRSGKPDQAIEHLENAIKLNPDDAICHRNLASALMKVGKKGRGLSEYRQALELAPGDPDLHLEYGQSLTELRAWENARKELEISRQLCSNCPESVQALANLFLVSKNYKAAVEPLRTLLSFDPTSKQIRRSLAVSMT